MSSLPSFEITDALTSLIISFCFGWRISTVIVNATRGLPNLHWCISFMTMALAQASPPSYLLRSESALTLLPPQMLISGCLCSLWIYHESPAPVYKPVGMLCAVWGIVQLVATILTMSTAIPDRWAEWWVRLLLVGSAVEEVLIAISCLLVAELTREMSPKSSRALYTFCAFISGESLDVSGPVTSTLD